MDFHSLSRKELQFLCKKNHIPANITNVAMAQALSALHQVEGFDELLTHPVESDAGQCPDDKVIGTPDIHRTACRTSTRKKAVRGNAEGTEQENKDANVPATPAMPSSRRKAPAISTRRKTKAHVPRDEKNGDPMDVPKTPAALTTSTRACNMRRSVRLLEKSLSKMSLVDPLVQVDDISEDLSNITQLTEDLAETDKKPIMQMVSTLVSGKTNELEVTSQEKNTEYELGSASENAARANLQAESHEAVRKISSFQAKPPHESNLKMEESSETFNYSDEVCDGSDFDLNKPIGKAAQAANQAGIKLEDSCDSTEPENEKCLGTKLDEPVEASEDASVEVINQDVAAFNLSVEVPDDASVEVTDQEIIGPFPMSHVNKADNHGGNDPAEMSALCNEVSGDVSMEVNDQDASTSTVEAPDDACIDATDQAIDGSLPVPSVSVDSVSLKGSVACNTDNQDGNYSAEIFSLAIYASEDASAEVADEDAAGSLPMSSVCNASTEISGALLSLPSYNTNTLVGGDVISEESVIAKQGSSISMEPLKHTIKTSSSTEVPVGSIDEVRLSPTTVAPMHEQKTGNTPIESIVAGQSKGEFHCSAQSVPEDVADEPIHEDHENKICMMKESTSICEYENMSMRGLKKMLKNLTLDGKSNSKSNDVAKEEWIGKENRLTAETQAE